MTKEYNVEETTYGKTIWYEENGVRYSFTDQDPGNSDYQRYLNPEAEHFTPNL
jgi:hypothetical protein